MFSAIQKISLASKQKLGAVLSENQPMSAFVVWDS